MDHDKVIKPYLNSKQYYKINPQLLLENDRYFMNSKLRLEDDQFQLFESVEEVTTRNKELSLIEMGSEYSQ